jgi:polar amino acid transport system substrate-binding protein
MKKLIIPLAVALGCACVFAQKKIELKIDLQDASPKFLLSKDGKVSGMCIEIMNLLESKEGFKFVYAPSFTPTKTLESNMESGQADIHFGWAKTPAREKLATFGEELYKVSYVGAVLANDKVNFKTINDLINLEEQGEVLSVFGVASTTNLMKISGLKVNDQGKDAEENLKKLMSGRGRVFIYHHLGIGYELQQPAFKGKFKVVKIDWESNASFKDAAQYVVFSKKVPVDTVQKVNAAVLKNKKDIDAIVQKYSTPM